MHEACNIDFYFKTNKRLFGKHQITSKDTNKSLEFKTHHAANLNPDQDLASKKAKSVKN